VIGSGPIMIGQACEFDYSGTQAVRALRSEGYRVILINSNPATIMTDPELANQVYIEPLTVEFLEKIIEQEKPDALLPTMGGQTALNLAVALAENGILKKHNVRMLGANAESIKKAEDRELFKKTMQELGIDAPRSILVRSIEEGKRVLQSTVSSLYPNLSHSPGALPASSPAFSLPLVLRPSFTLGGEGSGIAYTPEDFERLLARGLFFSPVRSVLIEESLLGWKEFELEVVRDKADNVIVVCSIENMDPMGIHTGDSITVAPVQTLTDKQFQHLRDLSKKIIRAINVETGGSNIQFAIKPNGKDAGRTVVIEMNPRVSRSSALASKATGFPIAKIATKLAVGYTLDELTNEITGTTPASFEPTLDYVVTKIPRFDFEKFTSTKPLLDTQMKSVGEVMAIGRNFKESLLKALLSLENNQVWLKQTIYDGADKSITEIENVLKEPYANRLWIIASALRRGITPAKISEITNIDIWFIHQINEIITLENHLKQKPFKEWFSRELQVAKQFGMSDRQISEMTNTPEIVVFEERRNKNISPQYALVDTCAAEFEAKTPYLYSTYAFSNSGIARRANGFDQASNQSVMILGSGPNRIGQGIEFDYCCVHASEAIKDLGLDSVMINCNPETVSTDHDVSTRLYFEPLTTEHVLEVFQQEKNVRGVIVQFGGQTPLKLCHGLQKNGIPILGTPVESIDVAEDRKRFGTLLKELEPLGIKQPRNYTAINMQEALFFAKELGYPLLIRPSYVLGGRGMRIVLNEDELCLFMKEAIEVSESKPVLMDRFLSGAVEVDVDALSDGEETVVAGILEHIEEAGIHSGDSACSIPPFTLGLEVQMRLREYTKILAQKLRVVGLMNIQFAIRKDDIFVLEVNPRASRTIPFVSKAVGVPLAKIATRLVLGEKLKDLGLLVDLDQKVHCYNVKMPVFPFHKFPSVDVLLGPEMKSTGEAMGRAKDFPHAYAKALLGASIFVPSHGVAFLSIADQDKPHILEIATKLTQQNFKLEATPGTAAFLKKYGFPVERVAKVGEGIPDCVENIASGKYHLVINTVSDTKSIHDSFSVRRTALEKKIPYCTLITTARAFVNAIPAMKALSLEPLREPLRASGGIEHYV